MSGNANNGLIDLVNRYKTDLSVFPQIYEALINARKHWFNKFNSILFDPAESQSQVDWAILKALDSYDPEKAKGKFETWTWTVCHGQWANLIQKRNSDSRSVYLDGTKVSADFIHFASLESTVKVDGDESESLASVLADPTAEMPWERMNQQDEIDLSVSELELCCSEWEWKIIKYKLDHPCDMDKDIALALGVTPKVIDNILRLVKGKVASGTIALRNRGKHICAGRRNGIGHPRLSVDALVTEYHKTESVEILDQLFKICEPLFIQTSERFAPYQFEVWNFCIALWTQVLNSKSNKEFAKRLRKKFQVAEANGQFKTATMTPFVDLPTTDFNPSTSAEARRIANWVDEVKATAKATAKANRLATKSAVVCQENTTTAETPTILVTTN